eukprot:scaffold15505_cov42-Phaeocystis_antarctica.AAC.3
MIEHATTALRYAGATLTLRSFCRGCPTLLAWSLTCSSYRGCPACCRAPRAGSSWPACPVSAVAGSCPARLSAPRRTSARARAGSAVTGSCSPRLPCVAPCRRARAARRPAQYSRARRRAPPPAGAHAARSQADARGAPG